MIKTLTLSIDEIRQLIEISDPDHRNQVLKSLTDNAATPPTEIAPENYAEAPPMALRLAQKIRRKAADAERRRSRRQNKQKQILDSDAPKSKPAPAKTNENVVIELSEATVSRLLWLKQNHKLWCKAINCIVESISGSNIPLQLRAQIQLPLNHLFDYLNPLIHQAADYHLTPKQFRPRFATIYTI